MRKLFRPLWFVVIVGLALSGAVRIAAGHADYEHSEPAADAIVARAPTQVQIWFTQELFRRQGENSIVVSGADGTRVDLDDATIDDDDRNLMRVTLAAPLADGLYTVHWFALSAEDGHPAEGEFTFTLASAATESNTESITASMTSTAALTTAVPVTAASEPEVTATSAATIVSTAAAPATPTLAEAPTATSSAPTSPLPCLGGAAPLALALGAVVVRRRQRG